MWPKSNNKCFKNKNKLEAWPHLEATISKSKIIKKIMFLFGLSYISDLKFILYSENNQKRLLNKAQLWSQNSFNIDLSISFLCNLYFNYFVLRETNGWIIFDGCTSGAPSGRNRVKTVTRTPWISLFPQL